ncbi:MAG: tetratricopeptide repeat protein, partial [Pseudomonadales bacterium]
MQRIPGSDDAMAFARANMQQGEWEAAKSELEALLRAQPTSIRALEYLAQAHIEMGNFSRAESTYARILQLDPKNSAAQAGLIRASQADSLGYEATLQALRNNYPDKAFIPYMLGNHFAGQRRWNEAA